MSTAPPALSTCSVCQTTLDPNGACPRCRAPEDWSDYADALDFVLRRLREWHQAGRITDRQVQALGDQIEQRKQTAQTAANAHEVFHGPEGFPRADECWSCSTYLYKSGSHCHDCGAPITNPGVKSLRYWRFLANELHKYEDSGWLTLRQAHEFSADTQERVDALQRKLERERAVMVIPVDEDAPPPRRRRAPVAHAADSPDYSEESDTPRRSFLEVILDPNTIRWLFIGGGILFVVGVVIWLASAIDFENPLILALFLGFGNAVLLGGGFALIKFTRFHNAGRALTLLACLVMPLNLWFYHTHKLLTFDNNLWVAALVCCVIYTAAAFVLRDPLFVAVLVGGITLTGLLILAQVNMFMEVFMPTTFLVVLGLVCLHLERAFPPGEGDFSRQRFGMAFYWSSQPLFAIGLLLLLGAQLIGMMPLGLLRVLGLNRIPDVATDEYLPYTLGIVLAGTYAYIYSDVVVRRIGVYLYLAAITVLWAEVHLLRIFELTATGEIIIISMAATGLLINVLQGAFEKRREFLRTLIPLGFLFCWIPLLYGILLHFRAVNSDMHRLWPFEITWTAVAAMALLAISCRVAAFVHRHERKEIAATYLFLTAAATLVFAAELLWMLGLQAWETEAPFLMAIPVLYLVASNLYKDRPEQMPLLWCGHAATILMIAFSVWAALGITPQRVAPVQGDAYNLLLAAFCFECTLFFGLASYLYKSQTSLYFAAVMLCGAIWQLLMFFHTPEEAYVVAFALGGCVLLVLHRLGVFEKFEAPFLQRAIFQAANALTTLGFVAGALLALTRWGMTTEQLARLDNPQGNGHWEHPVWIMLGVEVFLSLLGLLAAIIVGHPAWRRTHLVLAIINGILIAVMVHKLHPMSPWQTLEVLSIVVGCVLLITAYVGWYRETEMASDLVSIAFIFGSIALVMPMLIAIIVHRFHHEYEPGWNDLGLVISCVLLFGSGVMCRIKATTLVGSIGMLCYLVIILIGLHRHLKEAWIIGIYLTLGGVLLFGTGLVLSVYRDRLLALPARIRRREGLFRIFDWR